MKYLLAATIALLPSAVFAQQFTPEQMLNVMTKSPENRDVRVHDAIYVKADGIEGEATDSLHSHWTISNDASLPIFRSIPNAAIDQQRTKGETSLGDINFTRYLRR